MQIIITRKKQSKKYIYNRLRVPWLPKEIQIESGGTRVQSYEIINLGQVEIPNGENLETIAWSSTFPGRYHKKLPFLQYKGKDQWKRPVNLLKMLHSWKKYGTILHIRVFETKNDVTTTYYSKDVILSDYSAAVVGSSGDISYTVVFKEYRSVKVGKSKRPKVPNKYKIQRGDTLYSISVKFYGDGSMRNSIYNWNKKVIEKAAKKHRGKKKSSKHGKYLYAGTIITLKSQGKKKKSSKQSGNTVKKPTKKYTGKIPNPTLKKGMKGKRVKQLQSFLNYYCNRTGKHKLGDGEFGNLTKEALKAFQRTEKLTVDGIYGKQS